VFVVVYLPFLASFAVITTELALGQLWIFTAVVIVVVVDTAAYATGLAIGKNKLAPKISPAKTWEGFAGAAIAAAIAGGLLGHYLLGLGWWSGIVLGLVLLGSATMGDLVESLIKRDLGIKDMSSLLPGHGGFLDRLDSALPSMAVTYIVYQLLA
jgi:phosphatidate cytidylyltransferase